MPLMFNSILQVAGFSPSDVRLIRHKDNRASPGRNPYELWRDDREKFELYQSCQGKAPKNRERFNARYWAVFLGTPNDETMFVGIYCNRHREVLKKDHEMPHFEGEVEKAGSCDKYKLKLEPALGEFIGKLFIDWGPGKLAWVQHAEKRDKRVTELRPQFKEDDFPGYLNFAVPLSKINIIPTGWKDMLRWAKGVYLLTCPKTKEQYVGSATGEDGFWGRFQDYLQTGHGGNVRLKSRQLSDYRVSILEVAGTAATEDDIIRMEMRWQSKLQSRKMGLN